MNGDLDRGIVILREALEQARGDDALEAEILALLSTLFHYAPAEAEPYARSAVEIAERVGDPVLLAGALSTMARIEFWLGRGLRLDLWERALELDAECEAMPVWLRPVSTFGSTCIWAGDLDRARVLLNAACTIGYEREDTTVSVPLYQSCILELWADDWQRGLELARELATLGEQNERAFDVSSGLCAASLLHAHLGNEREARRDAAEAIRLVARVPAPNFATRMTSAALSLLELSLDRPAEALEHARNATSADRERGVEEPARLLCFSLEIEAAIAVGEWDEAEELLDWVEQRALRLDRTWALACAARCRGLLAAARGDEAGAAASFERALAEHDRVQARRFELARTLLAQGETLRRFKKRRAARQAIESARGLFEELGAQLWAAKARCELARIGGRTRADGLTETEHRVAALVATGRSNKEVANELFVTVRTVESNLTRIYEKLGIHSRAELAHRLR